MSIKHLLGLSHFSKIGPVGYHNLLPIVGNAEGIWHASREQLLTAEIKPSVVNAFLSWRKEIDLDHLHATVTKQGLKFLTIDDPEYPHLLRTIHDPPYLLYYKGELPPCDAMCVSVVGSRKMTDYGRQITEAFTRDFVKAGMVIASGGAYGVDETAHRAAMQFKGRTVAILGSGLCAIDTSLKQKLAEDIVEHGGCVITEFPPTMPALPQNFPIRNRIIAGMSKAIVVIEATLDSGSLITAKAGLHENRDVFAVPGSIFSENSQGTHLLIREGAVLTTSAQDVFDELKVQKVIVHKDVPALQPVEAKLYKLLSKNPKHIDDIAREAGMPAPEIASMLAIMEIQGVVRNLGGMRYIR